MTNIQNNQEKASGQRLLKIPDTSHGTRNDRVFARFVLAGKDFKVPYPIKLKKGQTVDAKTGIVHGNPEATSLILTLTERLKEAFKKSFLAGKQPSIDWLKAEIFGVAQYEPTPTLLVVMDRYFQHQYGEKTSMDGKTKEKNGYAKRYCTEWLQVEFPFKNVELEDLKQIHAEKLLNHVMHSKQVSKEHARRSLGFLDRALKFAVQYGWIANSPFQYVLSEKQFQRQTKEITKFLAESELALIINAEIHNQELDTIRKWFVLGCLTGMDWFTFINAEKSWCKIDTDGKPYLDGIRSKGKRENPQRFIVPLNKKADSLLKEFGAYSPDGNKLIFSQTLTNGHVNRMLKEIAGLAGVNRPISFNWGRKSFATILINRGVRAEIIKQMMGHAKLETTLSHYAKIDKSTVLKEGRF
jgi:site-specific recombinase XerD